MPVLDNEQHERFCQLKVTGSTDIDAYVAAGYKHNYGNASALAREAHVKARITELLQAAAKDAEVSVADVLRELAKLGFANMADYMRTTPGGDPALDFSALTRDQAAALVEVTVEDFVDGRGDDARDVRRVKFKLADKRAALVDIGKHLGMFVERSENTNRNLNYDARNLSDEELERIATGRGAGAAGPPEGAR